MKPLTVVHSTPIEIEGPLNTARTAYHYHFILDLENGTRQWLEDTVYGSKAKCLKTAIKHRARLIDKGYLP